VNRNCPRCGKATTVLAKLHGPAGGPEMCVPCGVDIRRRGFEDEKEQREKLDHLLTGFTKKAGATEVSRELITEVLQLTHPDLHTPARKEHATQVSAELTNLRQYAKPRPQPEPPRTEPGPPGGGPGLDGIIRHIRNPAPREYPCDSCFHLVPWNYCDKCAARREKNHRAELDKENERRRQRRAWRRGIRECPACGERFQPRRSDSKYCSSACRQRAYRKRGAA